MTNREVFNVLQELAFSVSRRLREARLEACGVEIFVRNNELQSYNYQSPIKLASQSSIVLARSGFDLFKEKYKWDFPVRAVGIRAIKLRKEGGGSQIDVFCDYKKQEKEENCDKAIYKIRKKYGREAISFLGLTRDIKLPKEMNEIITLPMNHYNF